MRICSLCVRTERESHHGDLRTTQFRLESSIKSSVLSSSSNDDDDDEDGNRKNINATRLIT